jgi:Na+/H+-dicarboxylate symporter/ABC-type amino acid transport substrate-binding protein
MENEKKKMTLSTKILIGMALGICVGLFFGEKVAWLSHVGNGFIKIMQMTILPYIMVSLIRGLGGLSMQQAKNLAVRGGLTVLMLWSCALGLMFLVPLVFPELSTASFFSTNSVAPPKDINYFDLYIPSNPFSSLANSAVPAVVVFSMAVGIALISIEPKKHLMNTLTTLNDGIGKITKKLVGLSPIGVFAITANAAGTISLDEIQRLQVHLISYVVCCLLLSFVVLPGLIMAITGYKYRDIMRYSKAPLIAAFTIDNLFVVLPMLAEGTKKILEENNRLNEQSDELVDVIIPISFNFPNMAKVLGLSFILFAGWFVNSEISVLEYPMFTISGLLSSFGSSSLTIPFMLNSYEIPEDMYQLFLLSGIIDRRFGTLLASVNLIALTLISIRFMTEGFKIKFLDLVKSNVVTIIIVLGTLFSVKMYFAYAIKDTSESRSMIHRLKVVDRAPEVIRHEIPDEKDNEFDVSLQDRIHDRAVIRIGYKKQNLPFTYLTDEEEIQGFDIQYAHRLANDLKCSVEFIPFTNGNMSQLLDEGVIDLAMSGIPWSPELLQKHLVSEPVLTVNLGLVVKDHRKKEFSDRDNRRTNKYKIAVLDQNPFIVKIVRQLKNLTLVDIASHSEFFTEKSEYDALLISAEAGAAWTLYHPGYSLVVPKPSIHKYALSFVLSSKNANFLPFLNQWLKMQHINGFDQENYNYWILGEGPDDKEARWSLGQDVFKLWDSSPEGQ